jgi:hypothetical protein
MPPDSIHRRSTVASRLPALDTDKLVKFLEERWGQVPCPMCHHTEWSVGDIITQLTQYAGGALVAGGPVYPLIPVVCRNCGNTVLVNAVVTGAIASQTQEPLEAVAHG